MDMKLKEARKKANVTQGQLARTLGVDIKTVGNWERGVTLMNIEQVWDCCVALECTPNDLCGWYDEHPMDADPASDPYESELVGNYRQLTPERKVSLLQSARDGAAMSKSVPERGAAGA